MALVLMAGLAVAVAGIELCKGNPFSSVLVIPDCYSPGNELTISSLLTTLRPIYPPSMALE